MIKNFEKHHDWLDVKRICEKLHNAGFKAWLAGGCVRDGLLKRSPHDFDIASDARPIDIENLFEKTIAIGKSFGVICVVGKNGSNIEVARFRCDGQYSDGRHPDEITPGTAEQDAERRDFTINALFYDVNEDKIYDFVGGRNDIKLKTIKTVGDPFSRFQEDYLRVLRAVRFAAQLGFKIESKTLSAVKKMAPKTSNLSGERIHEELEKLFSSKYLSVGVDLFFKTGLQKIILPELQPGSSKTILKILKKDQKIIQNSELVWLLIFSQIQAAHRAQCFDRLKFSGKEREQVTGSLKLADEFKNFEKQSLAKRKKIAANTYCSQAVDFFNLENKVNSRLEIFLKKNKNLPKPWITGKTLIGLGFFPGKEFGELLTKTYEMQLDESHSSRRDLIKWLKWLKSLA
jgi:tRNA nucleotidyltransferase (CCA-adding enzyme)